MEDQNNVARMIKQLRKEKGMTQKQLAELTGLSLSAVIAYENHQREPNSKAMAKLEQVFHVSGAYLRGEIDQNEHIGVIIEDTIGIAGERLLTAVRKGSNKTNTMMYDILVELNHVVEQEQKVHDPRYTELLQRVLFETTGYMDIINHSNLETEEARCMRAKQLALEHLQTYYNDFHNDIFKKK